MKPIQTVGKRKRAIARATLNEGSGRIIVNSVLIQNYTPELY
ncbi:30S ribosomal protein S9, partial [archaeon]|nr:30S ribosomal protein S9 [archaeon]